MSIERLKVSHLRNLTDVDITPSSQLNLILGPNASGKTSMLEAIYLIAHAKSFRDKTNSILIQRQHSALTCFAQLEILGTHHRVGIRKDLRQLTEIHIDGNKVSSSSTLAGLTPLQLITPESYQLLTEGPKVRRSFIDWLLFHVEQGFHTQWTAYRRAIKQRNSALKSGHSRQQIVIWDDEMVQHAEYINRWRRQIIKHLNQLSAPFFSHMLPGLDFSLSYQQGWSADKSLSQALQDSIDTDFRRHFTTVGPHRAELQVRVNNLQAAKVLSRGQMKLAVCALKLAQIELLKSNSNKRCIVLVDDLPAELDHKNRRLLIELLTNLGTQVFITSTDETLIEPPETADKKVFHVEHGVVQ